MCDEACDRLISLSYVPNGLADLFFRERIERGCSLVEYQQLWPPKERPGDRQTLLFAARYFHSRFPNHGVETAAGPQEQALYGRLPQHIQALFVGRLRLNEQQILPDRPGEQLRILGHKSDPLA